MMRKMNSDKHPTREVSNVLSRLKEIASGVMHAAEAETLELVLERIAQVARELVKARYAAMGIPDGHGGLKYFKVAGLSPEGISKIDHLPHGHGLLGAVMAERQTLRVEHIRDDPRSSGFPAHHPHMDRFLGAPIQVGEQLFGMLYLTDREDGQPFSDEDEWLVETLAGYAALAVAGSQLRDQRGKLTLLEERERISMELHDGVIQSLYAVGMHLELLRTSPEPVEQGLKMAINELNTVIDDIRNYIMDLRRTDSQRSIRDCLNDVVTRLHIPANIVVEIEAPDSKPLFSPAKFDSICQIINEALSNVVRHADATQVNITALQNDNSLLVAVKDNGRGFDPDRLSNQNGLGLRNIYQRVKMHGGQVMLDSAPNEGTRVTLTIPVKHA
jgi:signal transduction histidine kinase